MNDLRRLLRLYKPYTGWVLTGILLSFLTLLANVGLMAVSGWFITAMAMAGVAGVTMNYFTPSALIRLAAIVRTAGRYGERLVTHEATFRLLAELRVRFYLSLEPLAPAVLENYRSGDLLSRIRADIDKLDGVYLRLLLPLAVALLAGVLFVIALLFFHPLLALVELAFLLLAGVATPWLMNHLGHATGQAMVQTRADLRTRLVTDLQGMGELLVYGAAEAHAGHINALSATLAGQQQTMSRLQGISQGALNLFANLAMWCVLLVAIPLVSEGRIAPPELAMLTLFTLASFEAVLPLPLAFQTLGETLAAARRIFALVDSQAAVNEPEHPLPLPADTPLHFSLDQVSFDYPNGQGALQQVSLELPAGQCVALTGASGSGKSTLTHLLLRFRAADSGTILLNDQPIAAYSGEDLRARIAVVAQQTHLFNTSLRNNLLLANQQATTTELEEVCRLALLEDFVRQQPEGLETWCGETGVRLSGGQAKRVAIARALLKDASLLILDEPTEGLDAETAQNMMANILQQVQAKQKSLLLITHQRHGLAAMDRVYHLDQGQIIEQSTTGSQQHVLPESTAHKGN